MPLYKTDNDAATPDTVASFRVNNGCVTVPLTQGSFSRVVISGYGLTFHWNEGSDDAALRLQQLMNAEGLANVDGNYVRHDGMHFDEADKAQPNLHGHFLGDVEDLNARLKFLGVLEKLVSADHLTPGECGRVGGGIGAYRRLE